VIIYNLYAASGQSRQLHFIITIFCIYSRFTTNE